MKPLLAAKAWQNATSDPWKMEKLLPECMRKKEKPVWKLEKLLVGVYIIDSDKNLSFKHRGARAAGQNLAKKGPRGQQPASKSLLQKIFNSFFMLISCVSRTWKIIIDRPGKPSHDI